MTHGVRRAATTGDSRNRAAVYGNIAAGTEVTAANARAVSTACGGQTAVAGRGYCQVRAVRRL